MERIETQCLAQDAGMRLDAFVAQACGLSRSAAQGLIEQGHVLVNGGPAAKSRKLAEGDAVAVRVPPPRACEAAPQEMPLDIVYEDASLLVVNKPKGLVVHPAPGHPDGTLVNGLLHHCAGGLSGVGGELRPGIVHRIDKDTSGLLVVAKTDAAHQGLAGQFAAHSIHRVYHAVVHGRMPQPQGEVDAPIGRSRQDRKKMAVTARGAKQALTRYEVLREYPGYSHVALQLQTGRTHQIRVHMAHMGHPVAGDGIYGPKRGAPGLKGQCLHAKELGFRHPETGEEMYFTSDLPPYFTAFLRRLGAADF